MQFTSHSWEQQFQLSFNRSCVRTDILYACCLAAVGLSSLYRLQHEGGSPAGMYIVAATQACLPLFLLLLYARWPAHYIQHRQPLVAALKVWAALVAALLPGQFVSNVATEAAAGYPSGELLLRAGAGITTQLVLHALGFQTVGAWLVFSQGFVVLTAIRTAPSWCSAYLAAAAQQFVQSCPVLQHWTSLQGSLVSGDPKWLCHTYALGLQIGVGYCLTAVLGLLAEWRQRQAFAAKHHLEPPCSMDLFALHGCFAVMLLLLSRVAITAVVSPCAATATAAAGAVGTCTL